MIGRFLFVVLVFVGIGPPVGLVVCVVAVLVLEVRSFSDFSGIPLGVAVAFVYTPASYLVGGPPALATGIVAGAHVAFFGPLGFWPMLAIGLVIGIAFIYFTAGLITPPGHRTDSETISALLIASLAATLICWRALPQHYRRAVQTAGVP